MRALVVVIVLALSAGLARADAQISATPSSLEFGHVAPGETKVLTFVLSNNGTDTTTITSSMLQRNDVGYTVSNMPASLAPGASATVTVQFSPGPGMEGGPVAFWIDSNANFNTTYAVFISGNGGPLVLTCPICTEDTTGYLRAYYGIVGWQDTVSQPFTLANSGASDITIEDIAFSSHLFAVIGAPATPFKLPAGSSVSFAIATVPGSAMNISVIDNLWVFTDHTPGVATIRGTFQAEAVSGFIMLTPGATVDFGNVDLRAQTPATKTITIANVGEAPLSIADWPALSTGPFTSPGLAPVTLPAGGSQSVTVTYQPTAETVDTTTWVVKIDGIIGEPQPSPKTITITGHGADRHVQISADSIAFPPTFLDPNATVAPVATVRVNNIGDAPLAISALTMDGDPEFHLLETAPTTVAGRQAIDLHVQFVPLSVGSFTGALTILHDDTATATPGRSVVAISGDGVSRMLGIDPTGTIDFGGVHVGDSASLADGGRTITITNRDPTRSMTITAVECGQPPDTTQASFTTPRLQSRPVLAPGESASFDLDFSPADVGPLEGAFFVHFDGDFLPDVQVRLTGTGLPARNTFYACAAGDGGGGGLVVIALAIGFVVTRRRRR